MAFFITNNYNTYNSAATLIPSFQKENTQILVNTKLPLSNVSVRVSHGYEDTSFTTCRFI